MPGKEYVATLVADQLGEQVDDADLGQSETPVVYGPRTSIVFDGADMTSGRRTLVEHFELLPQRQGAVALTAPNPNFDLSGTNAATSLQGFTNNGVTLATAGALGDQVVCSPISGQTGWFRSINRSLAPLGRFRISTAGITNVRVELGERPTLTAFDDGTDADKMILRFDPTDGVVSATNWVLVTSNGGSTVRTDTGVPVAVVTPCSVVFAVDATGAVSCFIDDVLVNDPTAHILGPTNNGLPYAGIEALAASNVGFDFNGVARSYDIA